MSVAKLTDEFPKAGLPRILYYCNIESVGFALPGDPSVNLGMTYLIAVMLSISETSPGRGFTAERIIIVKN